MSGRLRHSENRVSMCGEIGDKPKSARGAMHCRACGHANRDDARFCENCGRETRAQVPAGGQRAQRYSRQAGGYASSGIREPLPYVPNHLVWAILATILCCLPTGIVAVVYSTQVDRRLYEGDYEGAKRASDRARTWMIVSVGAGLIWAVLLATSWSLFVAVLSSLPY